MGIFDGLLGKKDKKRKTRPLPFVLIGKMEQIEEMEELSTRKLIAVFKHSSRCATSRMAFNLFQKDFDSDWEENVQVCVVDVLNNCELSDEIANRFQVVHESPQLILIKDRGVVNYASHHRIVARVIEEFIESE